jgi:hypothetical protein
MAVEEKLKELEQRHKQAAGVWPAEVAWRVGLKVVWGR